jgi:4-hydroxybenzoyl-CoA thioesterase
LPAQGVEGSTLAAIAPAASANAGGIPWDNLSSAVAEYMNCSSEEQGMTTETKKDVFYSDMLVRFSHCDPAGIIFYPHYFVMFNGLVEDWFNHALEINYADFITTRRMGLPMVNIKCDFVAPSKIGEVITLTLKIDRIGKSSLTLAVGALLGDQTRIAAQLTLCVFSFETKRAVPIPDDLRDRLSDFKQGRLEHPWRQA